MSKKPSPQADPLDLSIRARSNALSADEARTFEHELTASAALRTAHALGQDIDRSCRVRSGDQALLDQVIHRTLAVPSLPPRSRRVPRVVGTLAAVVGIASAAAAATHVIVTATHTPKLPDDSALVPSSPQPKQVNARVRPAKPVSLSEPEAEAELSDESNSPSGVQPPAAVPLEGSPPGKPSTTDPAIASFAGSTPTTSGPSDSNVAPSNPVPSRPAVGGSGLASRPTAQSLFQAAGAARRAGDVAKARALYGELQSRFPGSNEANVSRVSLGKVLLGSGDARGAEQAFRSYLNSGAGALREEALVGLAQALAALGSRQAERAAWERLLRLYPSSVYTRRAHERILELEVGHGPRQ